MRGVWQSQRKEVWKSHKKVCRPFKICCNEELGRYVVATKPIKEGDVILEEPPLTLSPKHNEAICMGCSTTLNRMTFNYCKECGWPLCSDRCPDKANHKPECYYTKKSGKKISLAEFQNMQSYTVMALRCLYQKQFCPELWQKINELQSSCEESEKSMQLELYKQKVVKDIYGVFRLKNEFTEDEVKKVCGILAINRFNISEGSAFGAGIYQTGSMFEHSCKANAYRVFSPQGTSKIVSGMEIKAGDHLSLSYVDLLFTTPKRQEHLRDGKFFTCKCERCTDVTEFGTNFSALKCQNKNCKGILLPESFLIAGLQWTCDKCKFKLTADAAEEVFDFLESKLGQMKLNDSDVCEYKQFLKDNGKLVPQNHVCMVKAKLQLINKMGYLILQQSLGKDTISNDQIKLRIDLCHDVLDILQLLAPGEKVVKMGILMTLQNSLTVMQRKKLLVRTACLKDCRGILMEQKLVLTEILKHFHCYEPEMYLQFQKHLIMVEGFLAD